MVAFSRILVPLDGSETAEQVLPYARLLAKGMGLPILLFQVLPPPSPALVDAERGLYLDRILTSHRARTLDYLETAAEPLRREGVEVACEVAEGSPAEEIVAEAERRPGTLVAMTTHGYNGVARWVLGSVAERVLRTTTTPLLLVRARSPNAFDPAVTLSRVLIPLDGSPLAERILPYAMEVVRGLSLEVVLLRVVPSRRELARFLGDTADMLASSLEQARKEAQDYLEGMKKRLLAEGAPSVSLRLEEGDPFRVIVAVARETQDNLVAMSTHGRGGLGRWIIGSVTDRVVQHSGDPVLVVRPEMGQEETS